MRRKIINAYLLIFMIGISFVFPSSMNAMATDTDRIIKVRLTWLEFNCTNSRDGNQDNGEFYLQIKYYKDRRCWVKRKTTIERICVGLATDINKKITLRKLTLGSEMFVRLFDRDFFNCDDLVINGSVENHGRRGDDNDWASVKIPSSLIINMLYSFTIKSEDTDEYIIFTIERLK